MDKKKRRGQEVSQKEAKIINVGCNNTSSESFAGLYMGFIDITTHSGCGLKERERWK